MNPKTQPQLNVKTFKSQHFQLNIPWSLKFFYLTHRNLFAFQQHLGLSYRSPGKNHNSWSRWRWRIDFHWRKNFIDIKDFYKISFAFVLYVCSSRIVFSLMFPRTLYMKQQDMKHFHDTESWNNTKIDSLSRFILLAYK